MTMMIGASAQVRPKERHVAAFDYELMKEYGIEWVRLGLRVPFTDASMTETTDAFQEQEREIERIAAQGMKVMAITPFPTGDIDIGGDYPEWGGPIGSEGYLQRYEEVCAWLATRFRGVAEGWQISNYLSISFFGNELIPEQSAALLQRGGRGVKRANPDALVGFNLAGFDEDAMLMYSSLFPGPESSVDVFEFDYIGCDGLLAPEQWPKKFERLKSISDKPIIVQEFGYSSQGFMLTAKPTSDHPFVPPNDHCRLLGWPGQWGEDHRYTWEAQADYVAACMTHFVAEPRVDGVFFWRWDDAPHCFMCGCPSSICPGTGRYGLIDDHGQPKPSLEAFRVGASRLKQRANRREEDGSHPE
jgi:hypothetical protein